jgi:hypothetical protein
MTQPVVFISYSHKDEREKNRLLSHLGVLQPGGLISLWSDDRIGAGADWEKEIREAMAQAKVAILLISANFLTSSFILGQEVPTLLRRREREGLTVFPVIAKACAWQEVEWLTKMNIRPKNGRAIWGSGSRRIDEDMATIAKEVAAIVKTASAAPSSVHNLHKKSERDENNLEFLYQRLQLATGQKDWAEVLILGGQIMALHPHFRDVPEQLSQARMSISSAPQTQPIPPTNSVKAPAKIC